MYFCHNWELKLGIFTYEFSYFLKDKMGLRMKNFSIFGIHRKMWFFREVYKKPIYRGDCLKRGALAVGRFKGGLARKRRVVFKSKLKSDTLVKSNKHNSMMMFTFSVFDWSYLFLANLVSKFKTRNIFFRDIWSKK